MTAAPAVVVIGNECRIAHATSHARRVAGGATARASETTFADAAGVPASAAVVVIIEECAVVFAIAVAPLLPCGAACRGARRGSGKATRRIIAWPKLWPADDLHGRSVLLRCGDLRMGKGNGGSQGRIQRCAFFEIEPFAVRQQHEGRNHSCGPAHSGSDYQSFM